MRPFLLASLLSSLSLAACKFPFPADVNDDGRTPSDGRRAADASVDAPADARPGRTGPLIQNGQAADLVLGQPTFDVNSDRGISARSFKPASVAFASGRLWVVDYFRHRVLGWDTPTISDAAATYLLGQPDFMTSAVQPTSATSAWQATAVVATGAEVVVLEDPLRALIWHPPPVMINEPADLVLGAMNFTDQGQLSNLISGWSDGQRLILRRGFIRSRILIWSSFPTVNGTPPDLELQTAFDPTASNFGPGGGVISDGVRLIAADTQNNRVLIWNALPTVSGQPADIVLGQPTFTSNSTGTSAAAMSAPRGLLIVDGALFVADSGNDRVLVFDPIPTTSGASATQVLGQESTGAALLDQPPSDRNLNGPVDLALAGNKVFVADEGNRRVVRYDLDLP